MTGAYSRGGTSTSTRSPPSASPSVPPPRPGVVIDPAAAPVLDLAAPSAARARVVQVLRDEVRGRARQQANPHHLGVHLKLIGDRLAGSGHDAYEEEPPQGVGHERPFRGRNDASLAQAPHSWSSSFVTQPLRTARRSSSRSVVSSI